jgi:tripartite ATP-independent transporter DctP family solute receptor
MRINKLIARILMTASCLYLLAGNWVSAQEIQERTIKFGHLNNTDHPISKGVKKFGELIAAKSGGKLKVKEFPASQLGSDMQLQDALRGGTQEMAAPATTSLAGIVKEYGLLDFPFAVSNTAQADFLLDGPLGQALSARLPEKGLISLGYWELGFRNVTNSKRPITQASDLAGLKLRVIPNEVFVQSFKALGVNPIPMPIAEVYTAMETKAIDGHENPLSVIYSNKFYEVQKYVSATNHVYGTNILLISKKFWDKLSPTEKKIIEESMKEAIAYERMLSRENSKKSATELQAAGMQYNELPPEELAKMATIVQPITDKLASEYDPAIMKIYREELAKAKEL